MKIVKLERLKETSIATLGKLTIGTTEVATLEDPQQEHKIWGDTRIPTGTYNLELRDHGGMTVRYQNRYPDMHKGMIWLRRVPGFEWVYIHVGNSARDTQGCILVGMKRGDNMIYQSRDAYELIYPKIAAAIEEEGCRLVVEDIRDD
jgi:hypothetical protein